VRHVARMGEKRNVHRLLVGKPEGKRLLGRPRRNEYSGSIKCWDTVKWLHNLWPLEWYSAPQS
jgi:hypothetical protein